MIEVKFKRLHPDAVLPAYAQPGDAGMDLVAVTREDDFENSKIYYRFGLAMEIPDGYVGLIFPRSGIYKKGLILSNCVGVIDSGYRGEICAWFRMTLDMGWFENRFKDRYLTDPNKAYAVGDRIAQLVVLPIPQVQAVWAEELSDSVRGSGGFGSTGA